MVGETVKGFMLAGRSKTTSPGGVTFELQEFGWVMGSGGRWDDQKTALQTGTGSFQGPGHIQKCTGWRGPSMEAAGHGGGRTRLGRTVRELVHHIKDLGSLSGEEPSA